MKSKFFFFAAATLGLPFASGSIPWDIEEHSFCDNLEHPIKNYHGESETCKAGSYPTADRLTVTSYNIFMLWCLGPVPCEPEEKRVQRAPKLPLWFADRDDDIVFFQEMWSFNDDVKKGMLDAGFCGQATSEDEGTGSGLGIFTKFEILETHFVDWCDSICFDAPFCFSLEAAAEKGVMYAKIKHTDGSLIHAFNAHTESNTNGDGHEKRVSQFKRTKAFIDSFNIPKDEAVFVGGDMNEDYYCSEKDNFDCPEKINPFCSDNGYFHEMLFFLGAQTPDWKDIGYDWYTYNSVLNQLLAAKYREFDGECLEHYQTLDYVFYSSDHKRPNLGTSSCHVERAVDDTGFDLSDHNPVSCTFDFSSNETQSITHTNNRTDISVDETPRVPVNETSPVPVNESPDVPTDELPDVPQNDETPEPVDVFSPSSKFWKPNSLITVTLIVMMHQLY